DPGAGGAGRGGAGATDRADRSQPPGAAGGRRLPATGRVRRLRGDTGPHLTPLLVLTMALLWAKIGWENQRPRRTSRWPARRPPPLPRRRRSERHQPSRSPQPLTVVLVLEPQPHASSKTPARLIKLTSTGLQCPPPHGGSRVLDPSPPRIPPILAP